MSVRRLCVPLLLAALAVPAVAQRDTQPLSQGCPNLTPKEVAAIENHKGQFPEHAIYARSYCVSLEEAERRIAISVRDAVGPKAKPGRPPEDSIGAITAALQAKEAGTFAGLWIEHRPDYRVMVAFTRDAAATLAKYTMDPLFKPVNRPGPTLAELRATQERLGKEFTKRGFRWSMGGAREDKGIVEFMLGHDAAPIRAAAARGEFELPDYVVLVEPDPLPFPAPPPSRPGDKRVKSFPQFAYRTDMYARTLVGVPDVPAMLRLVDGCLKLETKDVTRTALWQASDALDLSDPARVTVVDRLTGTRIAADEEIVLMGLQRGEERVPEQIVGTQGCPGPYRVVRGYLPRSTWEARQREEQIRRRMNEHKDPARAAADYQADQARLPALRRWREKMLAERGDVVTAIWIDEDEGTAQLFHTAGTTREQLVPAELLPHVTAQQSAAGHDELEAARSSLETRLRQAGVRAEITVDPVAGVVDLRATDPRALSAAAVAGRVQFPPVVRVSYEGANPLSDDHARRARNPEDVWLRLEAAPDFPAIRKLVEATPLPVAAPVPPPRTGAPADSQQAPQVRYIKPTFSASVQTARFLLVYGQSPLEIAALKLRGFDPVDAMDAMNGRPTPVSRALLARQVVVAELVRLDPRDPGRDGFRSTATWRIVETLKGDARPGDLLRMRLVSGEGTDGSIVQSNEEPRILPGLPGSLEPGGRWLLHLNDALYQHMAFINGGQGAARSDGRWYLPLPIDLPAQVVGGEVKAPFFDQKPYPLEQLRRTLAPLQAAMVESGLVKEKRK